MKNYPRHLFFAAASFYHNLGIDPSKEFNSDTGRPITLVRNGKVIPALFG